MLRGCFGQIQHGAVQTDRVNAALKTAADLRDAAQDQLQVQEVGVATGGGGPL